MSVSQMLYHVNAAIRFSFGEFEARPVGDPTFWHTRGRAIALSDEPWPHGAPTFNEALASTPVSFDEERERFVQLLDRFSLATTDSEWPAHPRLGPLTGTEWGRLHYNHIDHHFRQFAV